MLAIDNARLDRAAQRAEGRLRDQLNLTRTITDTLAEGLLAGDHGGRVTFGNPMAEQLLGWPRGELVGERLHELARLGEKE